jgi:hypothetical protein
MPEISNISIIIPVIVCSISGILIYLVHGFFLNRYLLIQNNLMISIILPTVALVITRAISTNFFLSLGMIGALSIIRYRTPVKSAYELSLLFALITIGVVGNVNPKYALGLSIFISVIGICFYIFNKFFPKMLINNNEIRSKGVEMIITTNDQKNNILNKYSEFVSSIEDIENERSTKKTIIILNLRNIDEGRKIREEIINDESIENISVSPKYF